MLILALICAAVSLWAVFGVASIGVWLISTVLSIVFGILGFILKPALKFLLWICMVALIISVVGYFAMGMLPL